MQESRPNSGRPVEMHSAMLKLWLEEVRERLRVGHSEPGDIIPTWCSLQMSVRAKGDQFDGALGGLRRQAGEMRGKDDVGQGLERIRDLGFGIEHIQRGGDSGPAIVRGSIAAPS